MEKELYKLQDELKNAKTRKDVDYCPICQEVVSSDEGEFYEHIAKEHEEFIKKVISFYDSMEDFGYSMSCIKAELDNINTGRRNRLSY